MDAAADDDDVISESGEDAQKRVRLDVSMPFTCTVNVPCANERSALLTKRTLDVDAELTPDKVRRTLTVHGAVLRCDIESTEQRLLRASLASFFDMAMTAARVLCEFDDDDDAAAA